MNVHIDVCSRWTATTSAIVRLSSVSGDCEASCHTRASSPRLLYVDHLRERGSALFAAAVIEILRVSSPSGAMDDTSAMVSMTLPGFRSR
jgi:hypothetical protein